MAFSVPYQDIVSDVEKSVSFFTKYTQTFFEPFVESVFYDNVEDNRYNFVEGTTQKLYLYVTKNNNYYNLDTEPSVNIYDSTNTIISGLSGLTATHIRKGVYEVEFAITGLTCDGKKFFYDEWINLSIDNAILNNITQKFVPKPITNKYNFGNDLTETKRYKIQFYGIKQNEAIIRGEIRKVFLYFKSIDTSINNVIDEAHYRIFIKEGRTNVIVHDWTLLDKTNENYFLLDTSYFIPREYHVEFKGKIYGEEIFYNDYIKFEIISEK